MKHILQVVTRWTNEFGSNETEIVYTVSEVTDITGQSNIPPTPNVVMVECTNVNDVSLENVLDDERFVVLTIRNIDEETGDPVSSNMDDMPDQETLDGLSTIIRERFDLQPEDVEWEGIPILTEGRSRSEIVQLLILRWRQF